MMRMSSQIVIAPEHDSQSRRPDSRAVLEYQYKETEV